MVAGARPEPERPSAEPADATEDAGGDDDLDSLLADLDDGGAGGGDVGDDDDLDALLADLDNDDGGSDDEEMDPELAALLADL